MVIPDWIWFVFVFAFGACIGSFLNVVIYRLPRDLSLITPPSACPSCGKAIKFYHNIPIFSWLLLRGKCRYCKAPISPRYFVIELFTALVFTGLYIFCFHSKLGESVPPLIEGGWVIYLLYITTAASLIAASAIDLELWIIPISICWFLTLAGILLSTLGAGIVDNKFISQYHILPYASPATSALSLGALLGVGMSLLLVKKGVIKQSYAAIEEQQWPPTAEQQNEPEPDINDRIEICREVLFLLPVVICALSVHLILTCSPLAAAWQNFVSISPVAGFFGSLWGYFAGCAIVWITRIVGTMVFGKEAMGLGDVHLMGAAGTVLGPVFVTLAFFIAPFFGLAWAVSQMFFKKIRQIPYGPFLSLGILGVIIFHDWFLSYLNFLLNKG